jgi:hypothetical protein
MKVSGSAGARGASLARVIVSGDIDGPATNPQAVAVLVPCAR